ncbi:helix-turn-helix transcriptional regulator [Dyadobacter chenwenxiniae]|uniref:Helix-turn-helix transcriptional regulator n=1 Tax=Dyadobacter chenwenxiniae TaxID=2906456 RepID=A0A9X1PKV7_9BACT|nr:helix-turn-helix domain-containing protein [Dyadobacter chenwenxiniae]MCF0048510.1 helix-turn-helix transcriptional regulator [Dyadobacter chenwenxiniae]MCF0062641.1 helix-turn-helix transcriptional regulator [Dyadobacter chenwenxiniae]UON83615.1 helix-turn-helix transcriptional regulator [Dyadobacter chenwenxiniae]
MSKRKENSTNSINRKTLSEFCGVVHALDLIGGRWKMLILYKLQKGKMRFSELKNHLPNISERMLTLQLKELEKDHLIARTIQAEVPVRVEYSLTDFAKILNPIWLAMEQWGDAHREAFITQNQPDMPESGITNPVQAH